MTLWRYEDTGLGPRKIPTCEDLERDKAKLADSAMFVVDVAQNTVKVQENSSLLEVGSKMVYMVTP